MTVAVQVVSSLVHAVPRSEWVMTQHQPYPTQGKFGVPSNALPLVGRKRWFTVIVADDQMLAAVQSL